MKLRGTNTLIRARRMIDCLAGVCAYVRASVRA